MNEVRMGIIGVGNMGAHHASYMNAIADCKLTALCDTDSKRLNEIADKSAPDAKRFTSAHEMYKSGVIDAVLIATPHFDHPALVTEAFARRLHDWRSCCRVATRRPRHRAGWNCSSTHYGTPTRGNASGTFRPNWP